MELTAVALVLAGALLHALWNLAAKQTAGGVAFVWLYDMVSLCVVLPFAVPTYLGDPAQINAHSLIAVCVSALVHIAYSLALQRGYQLGEFSLVYPVARGSGPLFAVFGAILLLGEMPAPGGWAGIACILGGILLVSIPARGAPGGERALSGLKWGLLTGLCIALYTVIDGWAVKRAAIAPELYYCAGLLIRITLLAPQALRRPRELALHRKEHRWQVLCVGILSPLAYVLVLYAVTLAPLSYVAPLREVSMLIGVVLGARWLRELITARRLLGAAAMLGGVLLIALA